MEDKKKNITIKVGVLFGDDDIDIFYEKMKQIVAELEKAKSLSNNLVSDRPIVKSWHYRVKQFVNSMDAFEVILIQIFALFIQIYTVPYKIDTKIKRAYLIGFLYNYRKGVILWGKIILQLSKLNY